MKLFIDSGNLKDIESLVPLGIIDGITTNPSLLAKEPGDYRENLKKICQLVKGPTSAEVTATDFEGMMRQGRDLASIDPYIVVKVPFTKDGVKACKALSSEGKKVNVTLCFSPTQALLAAKVGANYISPFASVRHPIHIVEAARMGADICTCPAAVIEAMFKHPLTDIGLEKFLKDWEKAQAVKA